MEHATVELLTAWAERTFADREWVQKDEVLAAAKDADLPADGKRALKELPQARWSRQEMLYLVGTLDKPQERLRMDEPPDGVSGGGHEGESEQP